MKISPEGRTTITLFTSYLITWGDDAGAMSTGEHVARLANTARARGGELLTTECNGGAGILAVAPPRRFCKAVPAFHAIALMGWPDQTTRHAWYDGEHYRPYKHQRRESSDCTTAVVLRQN